MIIITVTRYRRSSVISYFYLTSKHFIFYLLNPRIPTSYSPSGFGYIIALDSTNYLLCFYPRCIFYFQFDDRSTPTTHNILTTRCTLLIMPSHQMKSKTSIYFSLHKLVYFNHNINISWYPKLVTICTTFLSLINKKNTQFSLIKKYITYEQVKVKKNRKKVSLTWLIHHQRHITITQTLA